MAHTKASWGKNVNFKATYLVLFTEMANIFKRAGHG
jgi:hypothetical protein